MRPFLLAVLLAVAAVPARAASLYAVEFIVFEHTSARVPGGELLPADRAARDPGPESAAPAAYARLSGGSLGLTALARRLQSDGSYRVIAHGGWWQPAVSPAAAVPVRLDAFGVNVAPGEALTGMLRLSRTQVLRVEADLALVRDAGPADGGRVQRLHVSRGVQPAEVHYLDHPQFGVLVQVRPASGSD